MGRTDSNESRTKSPVKYYVSFSGETGAFTYWDGEKNVQLEDLDLIMLDTRASISGWSDANNARIFSGYFRSTKDKVAVRCGNKDLMEGSYAVDKEKIKAAGGKFQTNVFALADINGDWTLVNLQMSSSSLMAWTSFVDENKLGTIYKSLIRVSKGPQEKKGRVLFFKPSFALEALPDDLATTADNVYKNTLKPYLEQFDQEPVAV